MREEKFKLLKMETMLKQITPIKTWHNLQLIILKLR